MHELQQTLLDDAESMIRILPFGENKVSYLFWKVSKEESGRWAFSRLGEAQPLISHFLRPAMIEGSG